MEVKIPIDELTAKVIEELKRLNYSYHSLCGVISHKAYWDCQRLFAK